MTPPPADARSIDGGRSPGPYRAGRLYLSVAGRSAIPVGVHFVPPEGPDWPWRVDETSFDEAFRRMAALGLDTVRVDVLWAAVEPEPGRYDERHLARLDAILEAARRNGLSLHPALFIGGEVGDAFWDVPWRDGRDPHADPEMRSLQAAHAAMLAARWRGDPAIVAWDLTDEPPFWISAETTDADAAAWTDEMVSAIRAVDPGRLVTVGTTGQEARHGPFRADVVAGTLDFACVHPYPTYQPELYPDALLSPRVTLAAAFETALAAGAGKPVMVHEYGASSAQFDPDRIAAYDRLATWSSLGRGAIGFYAWCWTDAERPAYGRAPYVRHPHETQFGVTDRDGGLRPRGRVLGDLAATLRHLDLDAFASRGPSSDAALVVPHEFVRPYDARGYGLGDAPAGHYAPAEPVWTPDRDVLPLMRGLLNGFVLAARAGVSATFPRESLDGTWPAVRLVLLPAPLTTSGSTLLHVRTTYLDGVHAHLARGGCLYLSGSAESAIPEMADVAGCSIADRAAAGAGSSMRFLLPWGPFAAGDRLDLPPAAGDPATRGVLLRVADAETIAVDDDGRPVLVVARRGAGSVVTCAHPVELLLALAPDAHGRDDRSWGLYAGLADLAGARDEAGADHPDVVSGCLRGDRGGAVVLTNHADVAVEAPLRLPPGARSARVVDAAGHGAAVDRLESIALPAHEVAIVTWEDADTVAR
jgi:hypothetical protein